MLPQVVCPDCHRVLMALEGGQRCLCPVCCLQLTAGTRADGEPVWAVAYLGTPEDIYTVVPRALPPSA